MATSHLVDYDIVSSEVVRNPVKNVRWIKTQEATAKGNYGTETQTVLLPTGTATAGANAVTKLGANKVFQFDSLTTMNNLGRSYFVLKYQIGKYTATPTTGLVAEADGVCLSNLGLGALINDCSLAIDDVIVDRVSRNYSHLFNLYMLTQFSREHLHANRELYQMFIELGENPDSYDTDVYVCGQQALKATDNTATAGAGTGVGKGAANRYKNYMFDLRCRNASKETNLLICPLRFLFPILNYFDILAPCKFTVRMNFNPETVFLQKDTSVAYAGSTKHWLQLVDDGLYIMTPQFFDTTEELKAEYQNALLHNPQLKISFEGWSDPYVYPITVGAKNYDLQITSSVSMLTKIIVAFQRQDAQTSHFVNSHTYAGFTNSGVNYYNQHGLTNLCVYVNGLQVPYGGYDFTHDVQASGKFAEEANNGLIAYKDMIQCLYGIHELDRVTKPPISYGDFLRSSLFCFDMTPHIDTASLRGAQQNITVSWKMDATGFKPPATADIAYSCVVFVANQRRFEGSLTHQGMSFIIS